MYDRRPRGTADRGLGPSREPAGAVCTPFGKGRPQRLRSQAIAGRMRAMQRRRLLRSLLALWPLSRSRARPPRRRSRAGPGMDGGAAVQSTQKGWAGLAAERSAPTCFGDVGAFPRAPHSSATMSGTSEVIARILGAGGSETRIAVFAVLKRQREAIVTSFHGDRFPQVRHVTTRSRRHRKCSPRTR